MQTKIALYNYSCYKIDRNWINKTECVLLALNRLSVYLLEQARIKTRMIFLKQLE